MQLKCSRERPICVRCKRLGACCIYPALADRRRTNPTRRSSRPQTSLQSTTRRALHRTSPGSLDRDAEANRSPAEELQRGEVTTGLPREPHGATRDQGQLFSVTDLQDEVPYLEKLPNSFNFEVCRARTPNSPRNCLETQARLSVATPRSHTRHTSETPTHLFQVQVRIEPASQIPVHRSLHVLWGFLCSKSTSAESIMLHFYFSSRCSSRNTLKGNYQTTC